MTNNINSTLYDIAQVGEDVDRICIVSNVTGRIIDSSPFFDSSESNDVRALCRVLDAAFQLGRDGGGYLVDERKMGQLVEEAVAAGVAARKGPRA